MPVYRNSDGALVIHFGAGDLTSSVWRETDSPSPRCGLSLHGVQPGDVGRIIDPERDSPAALPLVVAFENAEAAKVVRGWLDHVIEAFEAAAGEGGATT